LRLAILSNSFDASSAILAELIEQGGGKCFQLHTDLLTDYQIKLTLTDFAAFDPSGAEFRLSEFDAVYVRKPWLGGAHPERIFPDEERAFVRGQLRSITDELICLARLEGKLRLVEPATSKRCSKFVQMREAQRHFAVASAEVTLNATCTHKSSVVKTLAADTIGDDKFLFVDKVDTSELDQRYPWFTQELIVGDHDVTAVFVGGHVFWFRVARSRSTEMLDWRSQINSEREDTWVSAMELSRHDDEVRELMGKLGLFFGRLDFILDGGKLWFLEVNPNGQYAWLDLEPPYPIHSEVLRCILSPSYAIR